MSSMLSIPKASMMVDGFPSTMTMEESQNATKFGHVTLVERYLCSKDEKHQRQPSQTLAWCLETTFFRFINLAESKVQLILQQSAERELDLHRYLQSGIDLEIDACMDSLGSLAKHAVLDVITSLFEWRELSLEAGCPEKPIHTATAIRGSSARANIRSLEQMQDVRMIILNILFCRVLIRIIRKLEASHLKDDVCSKCEELAFSQLRLSFQESTRPTPNWLTNATYFSRVLGEISGLRFNSITDRYVRELEKCGTSGSLKERKCEHLIFGMRFIQMKLFPMESVEDVAEFLLTLSHFFLNSSDGSVRLALAETFVHLLLPLCEIVSAEVNVPTWITFVESIYPKVQKMAMKPRYQSPCLTLLMCLLSISTSAFFAAHWLGFLDICQSKFRDRTVRTESLLRFTQIVWVYLFRYPEPATAAQTRLHQLMKLLFPAGRRVVHPPDVPADLFIYMVYIAVLRYPAWALRHVLMPLLHPHTSEGGGYAVDAGSPERMAIALETLALLQDAWADGLQRPAFPTLALPLRKERAVQVGAATPAHARAAPPPSSARSKSGPVGPAGGGSSSNSDVLKPVYETLQRMFDSLHHYVGGYLLDDEKSRTISPLRTSFSTGNLIPGESALGHHAREPHQASLVALIPNNRVPFLELHTVLVQLVPKLPLAFDTDRTVDVLCTYVLHIDKKLCDTAIHALTTLGEADPTLFDAILISLEKRVMAITERQFDLLGSFYVKQENSVEQQHSGVLETYVHFYLMGKKQEVLTKSSNNNDNLRKSTKASSSPGNSHGGTSGSGSSSGGASGAGGGSSSAPVDALCLYLLCSPYAHLRRMVLQILENSTSLLNPVLAHFELSVAAGSSTKRSIDDWNVHFASFLSYCVDFLSRDSIKKAVQLALERANYLSVVLAPVDTGLLWTTIPRSPTDDALSHWKRCSLLVILGLHYLANPREVLQGYLVQLTSDFSSVRDATHFVLSHTAPSHQTLLLDELLPLVQQLSEDLKLRAGKRFYAPKKMTKLDRLRVEVPKLLSILHHFPTTALHHLVTLFKHFRTFLMDQKSNTDLDTVRAAFCIWVHHFFSCETEPMPELRASLFHMLHEWSEPGAARAMTALIRLPLASSSVSQSAGPSLQTAAPPHQQPAPPPSPPSPPTSIPVPQPSTFSSSSSASASSSSSSSSSTSSSSTSAGVSVQEDRGLLVDEVLAWIAGLLQPAPPVELRGVARQALKHLLSFNPGPGVFETVLQRCYAYPATDATYAPYFWALADAAQAHGAWPAPRLAALLVLAITKFGDLDAQIRRSALDLLVQLQDRAFLNLDLALLEAAWHRPLQAGHVHVLTRLNRWHTAWISPCLSEIYYRLSICHVSYYATLFSFLPLLLRDIQLNSDLLSLETRFVLDNLLYFTIVHGKTHALDLRKCWLALASDSMDNLQTMIQYFVFQAQRTSNPVGILHFQSVLSFFKNMDAVFTNILAYLSPTSFIFKEPAPWTHYPSFAAPFFIADLNGVLPVAVPQWTEGVVAALLVAGILHYLSPFLIEQSFPLFLVIAVVLLDHPDAFVAREMRSLLHSVLRRDDIDEAFALDTLIPWIVPMLSRELLDAWNSLALCWAGTCTILHVAIRALKMFRYTLRAPTLRQLNELVELFRQALANVNQAAFVMECLMSMHAVLQHPQFECTPHDLFPCLEMTLKQVYLADPQYLEPILNILDRLLDLLSAEQLVECVSQREDMGSLTLLLLKAFQTTGFDACRELLNRLLEVKESPFLTQKPILILLANIPYLVQWPMPAWVDSFCAQLSHHLHAFDNAVNLKRSLLGWSKCRAKTALELIQHLSLLLKPVLVQQAHFYLPFIFQFMASPNRAYLETYLHLLKCLLPHFPLERAVGPYFVHVSIVHLLLELTQSHDALADTALAVLDGLFTTMPSMARSGSMLPLARPPPPATSANTGPTSAAPTNVPLPTETIQAVPAVSSPEMSSSVSCTFLTESTDPILEIPEFVHASSRTGGSGSPRSSTTGSTRCDDLEHEDDNDDDEDDEDNENNDDDEDENDEQEEDARWSSSMTPSSPPSTSPTPSSSRSIVSEIVVVSVSTPCVTSTSLTSSAVSPHEAWIDNDLASLPPLPPSPPAPLEPLDRLDDMDCETEVVQSSLGGP